MSITRLQQARQMYALGKLVERVGFRGGGRDMGSTGSSTGSSGPAGGASSGGSYGGNTGGGNTGGGNTGGGGGNDNPFSSGYQGAVTQTKTATPMDVKEQYAVNNPTTLGASIAPPTVSPFLEAKRKDNYIDAFNLSNSTYKPVNIPPFIPFSTAINTAGNFLGNLGYKKNTQFFADNVAGKYGYGYGEDAYKDYMKARQLGTVNAYGRPLTEGELRLRDGDGNGGQGIMDVVTERTIDDTTDDTTNEDGSLILRFLHDNPQEVVNLQAMGVKDTDEMLQIMLDRAKNLYTT